MSLYSELVWQLCEGNKISLVMLVRNAWASLVAQWLRICPPMQKTRFDSWSGKIHMPQSNYLACALEPSSHNYPTPVLLPGKSHGRRSLAGCSPWGREESDVTERLQFHFSLSLFTFMHRRRKWQPTPVFLPGESHGQRSLVGCSPSGRTESDKTEVT